MAILTVQLYANPSIIIWYVRAPNLLSLAVSPDEETPHPPPDCPLSNKQPMNKLINFTGRGSKTKDSGLKRAAICATNTAQFGFTGF